MDFESDILHPENTPNLSLKLRYFRIIPCCYVFKSPPFTCSGTPCALFRKKSLGVATRDFLLWKSPGSLCSPSLVFLNKRQSLGSGDVILYCSNLFSFKWTQSIVKQPWAVFWIRHLTSLCISHLQNEHNDSYLIVKKFNDISVHCLAYTNAQRLVAIIIISKR